MFLIARSVSKWYPELFLIISVLIYWVFAGIFLNPVAIVLLALLFAQLTYKNKALGTTISIALLLLVSWTFLTMLVDMVKADAFIWTGLKMLLLGGAYLGITGYYAVVLFIKNMGTMPDRYPLGSD